MCRTPGDNEINHYSTPHELLEGTAPQVNHLCVLGCGAYVYVPPNI